MIPNQDRIDTDTLLNQGAQTGGSQPIRDAVNEEIRQAQVTWLDSDDARRSA